MLSCSSEHFIRIPCLKYCRNVKQDQIVAFIFWESLGILLGFPRWLSGKESTCQYRRCRFDPWVGKIPGRGKRQPTPVFVKIPRTEEPGGLQSMGSQRVNMTD